MKTFLPLLLLTLFFYGCGRGIDNQEAVKQGVLDYLSTRGNLNVSSMQVDIGSVSFRQNEADAVVVFRAKGSTSGGAMQIRYTLERKGNHWVVKGKSEGANPHSAGAGQMPGMTMPGGNPHGGMTMPGVNNGGMVMPPGHPSMTSK